MKMLLSGIFGAILGLICVFFWWGSIMHIIKGFLAILIVGMSFAAIFVGYNEVKEKIKEEKDAQKNSVASKE